MMTQPDLEGGQGDSCHRQYDSWPYKMTGSAKQQKMPQREDRCSGMQEIIGLQPGKSWMWAVVRGSLICSSLLEAEVEMYRP